MHIPSGVMQVPSPALVSLVLAVPSQDVLSTTNPFITSSLSVAVVELTALLAVTVYVVNAGVAAAGVSAVGVPVMTPVLVLRLMPVGRVGEIEKLVAIPVAKLGVFVAVESPR